MQCQGFNGPCKRTDATRNRQNTQYHVNRKISKIQYVSGVRKIIDDENYATLCPECQKESNEYWAGMWAEYWSSVL